MHVCTQLSLSVKNMVRKCVYNFTAKLRYNKKRLLLELIFVSQTMLSTPKSFFSSFHSVFQNLSVKKKHNILFLTSFVLFHFANIEFSILFSVWSEAWTTGNGIFTHLLCKSINSDISNDENEPLETGFVRFPFTIS